MTCSESRPSSNHVHEAKGLSPGVKLRRLHFARLEATVWWAESTPVQSGLRNLGPRRGPMAKSERARPRSLARFHPPLHPTSRPGVKGRERRTLEGPPPPRRPPPPAPFPLRPAPSWNLEGHLDDSWRGNPGVTPVSPLSPPSLRAPDLPWTSSEVRPHSPYTSQFF